MTDWNKVAEEIRQHIIDGNITRQDIINAQEIEEYAPEVNTHDYLRALAGWTAELDEYAVRYLRSEIALEEKMRGKS